MESLILNVQNFTHRKARKYAKQYIKNVNEIHERLDNLLKASLEKSVIELPVYRTTPLNYLEDYIETLSCGIAINFELTKTKSVILPILEFHTLSFNKNGRIYPKRKIYLAKIPRMGDIKTHRSLANRYRERLHNLVEWQKYRLIAATEFKDESEVIFPKNYLIA